MAKIKDEIKEVKAEEQIIKDEKDIKYFIQYSGIAENPLRYGKAIPKVKTQIDVAKFFDISKDMIDQRIKDINSRKGYSISME